MQSLVLQVAAYSYNWIFLIIFVGVATWLLGAGLYQRRLFSAAILAILSAFTIIYGVSIYSWLSSLGSDSLTETQNFNWEEAKFFLETATLILTATETRKIIVLILASFSVAFGIEIIRRLFRISITKTMGVATLALVAFPIILAFKFSLIFESNSETYKKLLSNFSSEFNVSNPTNNDLQVIVYIGESVSAMHLEVYNYFRNTSPNLSRIARQDIGFIKFNNSYSPHTHTAESLLETLSIPTKSFSQKTLVTEQKRISIVNILNSANIETRWISNQAPSGTGAYTATIIANNAKHKVFSAGSKYASGIDSIKGKSAVFDEDLFIPTTAKSLSNNGAKVVFLHSYAGHGPYLKSVPPAKRNKVDSQLNTYDSQALFGKIAAPQLRAKLEFYDTAVKYVDYNIGKVITQAKQTSEPAVVIFFSDHGESLYSGRGHDSARYVEEMARIPLLIYFNQAAQKTHSTIFKQLKKASKTNNPIIASQLPYFILELFGLKVTPSAPAPKLGAAWDKQPIYALVRRTINTDSYLQLNPQAPTNNHNQLTDAWKLQSLTASNTQICYHRANSLGKIIRGTFTLPCIEIDAIVEDDKIFITHPPAPKTNLDFKIALKIAAKNNSTIWFDGKNLNQPKNCQTLLNKLTVTNHKIAKIFVEFPAGTNLRNQKLTSCAKALNNLPNAETAFYVPAKLAEACQNTTTKTQCKKLTTFLQNVINTKAFSNFSFSYPSTTGMELTPNARHLKWNTWGIESKEITPSQASKFNLLIIESGEDPNDI